MIIYRGKNNIYNHEYSNELNNLINESYENNGQKNLNNTHFNYTLEKLMIQSGASDVLETINCALTLIEVIFYIISTYTYPEETNRAKLANKIINIIEIIFLVYFIGHLILKMYITQNKLLFFFDLINLIDIGSIVCIILSKQQFAQGQDLEYYLRMFRMIRFTYLLKMENILQRRTNEQSRYTFKLVISLISIVFLSCAVVLEVENSYSRSLAARQLDPNLKNPYSSFEIYSFHDILYYEFVTLTTIGFGDIYPKSTLGRIAVIITIVCVIAVIPVLYSKMTIVFSLNSKYSRISYSKTSKLPNHLVLIGNCSPESFDACLQELYHDDHGNVSFDTVIMQLKPNEEMLKIYSRKKYKNHIFYLAGDVLDHKDLERLKIDRCICVIILANKLSKDYKQEDFNNIMKAFSIKKYSNMICGPHKIRLCIQLLLPETKKMYYTSLLGQKEADENAQLICVEELKLQILGKSCLCQGINTIIASLIASEKPTKEKVKYNVPIYHDWFNEYLDGLENEIYVIKIKAELLHSISFNEMVKIIYELTGFIAIGTDIFFRDLKPFVCLNPSSYLFAPFDHQIYLLASSQPNENEINDLMERYLEDKRKGTMENNAEMVKIRRIKNSYWNRLNTDGSVKEEYNDETGDPMDDIDNLEDLDFKENYGQSDLLDALKFRINTEKDEDTFIKNYITTPYPRTRRDSETFNFDTLKKHIIIFGINMNIRNLILPLRARYNGHHVPILIMDKAEHIPNEIWKEINRFPDVYYMQGNAIKSDDLKRSGLSSAKAAIILAKYTSDSDSMEMMDANSIFIYQAVKNEAKKVLLFVDLVSVEAIGYISPSGDENIEEHGFWLSEAFAAGELYISSMLDTLICQSFYNPYILSIISQMMLGESSFSFPEDIKSILRNKKLIQASLNLFKIKDCLEDFKCNNTDRLISFQNLFETFNSHSMIPIGVLRMCKAGSGLKNEQKFVFINPSKDVMIDKEFDSIYVISFTDKFKVEVETEENDPKISLIEKGNEMISNFDDMITHTLKETEELSNEKLKLEDLKNLVKNCLENEFVKIYKSRENDELEEATRVAKIEEEKINREDDDD